MIDKAFFNDLKSLKNDEYIKKLYRELLGRNVDNIGLNLNVQALENGTSREDIFYEIRLSDEGINKGVDVQDFIISKIQASKLLQYNNAKFLEATYLSVLGRTIHKNEKQFYLQQLSLGLENKISLLYSIRFSEEGKKKDVEVEGLNECYKKYTRKNRIKEIPFFGRIFRYIWNILHINRTVNSLKNAELNLCRIQQQMHDAEDIISQLKMQVILLDERVKELESDNKTKFIKNMPMEVRKILDTIEYTTEEERRCE